MRILGGGQVVLDAHAPGEDLGAGKVEAELEPAHLHGAAGARPGSCGTVGVGVGPAVGVGVGAAVGAAAGAVGVLGDGAGVGRGRGLRSRSLCGGLLLLGRLSALAAGGRLAARRRASLDLASSCASSP